MDPLATYTGSLQCWNWSDIRESGGVPFARLAVWPGYLEMSRSGLLKAVFRPRSILKERVRLIRQVVEALDGFAGQLATFAEPASTPAALPG